MSGVLRLLPLFFTNKPKCLTTMQWMYGLGKTSPSRYEIRPVWLLVLRVRLNAWHAGLVFIPLSYAPGMLF